MPVLSGTTTTTTNYARYAHELAFSIYFPLLLIWVNDASSKWANRPGDRVPWVLQMKFLITRDYSTHSLIDDPKLNFAFVSLWAMSGLGIFLLLRILGRFPFTPVILRTFAGIVAVAGFPLTFVYAWHRFSWTLVEVVAALVCAFLYLSRSWPRKAPWGILLLILHFTIWSLFAWGLRYSSQEGGGVPLLWPGFRLTWLTAEAPQLIYPWLGFLASVAWALYVRQTTENTHALDQTDG